MRNRIFGWIMTVGFVAGGGEVAAQEPLRQGPQEEGVVLRFDEARRDTLADVPSATAETLPAAACAAVRLPDSSHSTCTPLRYLADAAARPCGGRVRRRISTVAPVRAVSYRRVAYDGS